MCICEFCHQEYPPRPQVKKPRACPKCQKQRQQANEKAWKEKHIGLYDGKYHRIQREQRRRVLQATIAAIRKCLEVGNRFLNLSVVVEELMMELSDFIFSMGVRRANKFWPVLKAE
jgi:transposase-like protein